MDLNAPDAPQFASATARVDAKKAGLRIQEALPGMFPEVLPSRKSCRKALDRGDILLNGVVADTARRVQIGDTVTLNVALQPPTPPGKGIPTQFQWHRPPDADYLFVWKPAGLSTSGVGNRHLAGTLAHLAHAGTPAQRTDLRPHQPDALRWPQPVHRLDRVTAGWVCIALTLSTAQSLGQAFAERTVHKKYLALVAGNPENAGQSHGTVGRQGRRHTLESPRDRASACPWHRRTHRGHARNRPHPSNPAAPCPRRTCHRG